MGYSRPKPKEAKKVLSPNSPTTIEIVIKATAPKCKNLNLSKKDNLLEELELSFLGRNPIIPKRIKEKYVKSFK